MSFGAVRVSPIASRTTAGQTTANFPLPRLVENGLPPDYYRSCPKSQIHKTTHWKARLFVVVVASLTMVSGLIAGIFLFAVIPQLNQASAKPLSPFPNEHRYNWPQPSYSLLGKFRRAAVTCDHGICSEIGRDIMLKGGNAVDSSIASLFCLGVTNPQSSGIGGGFIMTLYNRTTQSCKVIDARETAPKASSRDMYGNDEWASKYGYRAIAIPGEIAGYWLAFKEFGSRRVNWSELIMPSVKLARNGVPVSEYLAKVLQVKEKHFRTLPSMQSWINNKTDKVYEFGDIIYRLELANTMEKLALTNDPVELFYNGEMADTIVSEIKKNGGLLTKEDLIAYKPKVYDRPLTTSGFFGNLTMCGPPPPSSFAVAQAIVSVMVARYSDHKRYGNPWTGVLDDTEFYHWLIESQKFAYAYRTRLGDVDFVPEALELSKNLSSKRYIHETLRRIPPHAMFSNYYSSEFNSSQKDDSGTSHVSVIDPEGNGVSATSTVNRWFGAVVQSESLGIVWNDEMDDFSTPGMSNGFGFAPSSSNFIEPGKRPMSSMSPMVIYDTGTGNLKFVIGASGGSKIISALAKPIIRVLCFNETIKQAIDAPTLHNQFTPDITQYEESVPKQLLEDLETKFKQKFKQTTGFEGVVQGIVVGEDNFLYANGDYRRKTNMHPEGF